MTKKFLSILLSLTMIMCMFTVFSISASAAPKTQKRTIAIVFDNSGSMYQSNNAWCRATYAMEVFATMMNKDDKMLIYPMWEITIGKGGPKYSDTSPFEVKQEKASEIRNIYTPHGKGTPASTIEKAAKDLIADSSDNEKWLIVLTDGEEFNEYEKSRTQAGLEDLLGKYISDLNIMYLGIGENAAKPENVSGKYYFESQRASDSRDVLSYLTAMCNTIFGRDSLRVDLSSQNLDFDLSLKKLIVFIQGEGIKDVSVGGLKPISVDSPSYGTLGAGKYSDWELFPFTVDESLQGSLLTFGAAKSGTYPLSYSGTATSIATYYEPDVDLMVKLLNENGKEVVDEKDILPGTYYIEYYMVDNEGNRTNSELLGDVEYSINYTIDGQEYTISATEAGKHEFTIEANQTFEGKDFDVTYLGGYKIHRLGVEFPPFKGFKPLPLPPKQFDLKISQSNKSYPLTSFDGDKYRVLCYYDNDELKGADLDKVSLDFSSKGGNAVCKLDKDSDGYFINISCNKTPLETNPGNYSVTVSGKYVNKDGMETNKSSATASFSIIDNSCGISIAVDQPQNEYLMADLDTAQPIYAYLTMGDNNEKMSSEYFKNTKFSAECDGLYLIVEPVKDSSAYKICLNPDKMPSEGDYTIKFTAKGKNEIGKEVTATNTASLSVVDNSSAISIEIDQQQKNYTIARLKGGKPIYAHLKMGKATMPSEFFETTEFTAVCEGLDLIIEKGTSPSSYKIRINPKSSPKTGSYRIDFSAKCLNEIGTEVTASAKAKLSITLLPVWLIWIIIILILLVIALIIWLIMNQKVLPKRIDAANEMFSVDGTRVPGRAQVRFDGGGKRKGSITITSPKYSGNPLAKVSVKLDVIAISPRYINSKKRRMSVISSSPNPKNYVPSYNVGTASYTRDYSTPAVVFNKMGTLPGSVPKPYNIANNSMISVSAQLADGTSVSFSCNIKTV